MKIPLDRLNSQINMIEEIATDLKDRFRDLWDNNKRSNIQKEKFWGNNGWKRKFSALLTLLTEEQNWSDWEFLIRNQRGQK